MMRTINQFQVASILEYLDAAVAALPPSPALESTAAWNIRMARKRLYAVALADVAVEPANDDAAYREAA
jgi:hypothetical protein